MKKYDAFYIVSDCTAQLLAEDEDCIFHIAGAVDEGWGESFFRSFEKDTPIGDIHQIHGKGAGTAAACISARFNPAPWCRHRVVIIRPRQRRETGTLICGYWEQRAMISAAITLQITYTINKLTAKGEKNETI